MERFYIQIHGLEKDIDKLEGELRKKLKVEGLNGKVGVGVYPLIKVEYDINPMAGTGPFFSISDKEARGEIFRREGYFRESYIDSAIEAIKKRM